MTPNQWKIEVDLLDVLLVSAVIAISYNICSVALDMLDRSYMTGYHRGIADGVLLPKDKASTESK